MVTHNAEPAINLHRNEDLMEALLVIDAQNEFSDKGLRAVPNHVKALEVIVARVEAARASRSAIAWIQHHNKPTESRAFVPGSWGAQLSPGLGASSGFGPEHLFVKDVYGAFSGAGIEGWLRSHGVTDVVLVGFYTHMCLSTAAREALVRGFEVTVDPDGTGARDLADPVVGHQSADDVRRSALLHLTNMGVKLARLEGVTAGRHT